MALGRDVLGWGSVSGVIKVLNWLIIKSQVYFLFFFIVTFHDPDRLGDKDLYQCCEPKAAQTD